MRTVKFTFNKNVVPVSLGVPVFYWEECLWDTYRFSVFFDFFIRVFSSTPINKRVFSNRCLFGGKYTKYEWFVQIIECQRFLFDAPFSVMQ